MKEGDVYETLRRPRICAAVPRRQASVPGCETGVCVEFVVAGEYPGDGKPKPVAFPDPESFRAEPKACGRSHSRN
jgi:hypothetical protein